MLLLSGMRPTEPSACGLYRDYGMMTFRSSIFSSVSFIVPPLVVSFLFVFAVFAVS